MSTGQPVTVRPRNGTAQDATMTKRTEKAGVPSRFSRANRVGIAPPFAMACMRRLVATNVPNRAVSRPQSIAVPTSATPAFPSAVRAAAKTGIASSPPSSGTAAT